VKRILAPVLALVAVAFLAPGAHAAGPWRATIVDAETGQPLEGVVVVAAFTKFTKSLAGTAGGEYYGSDEVVTGADGRFEIPARNLWNPIRLFTEVRLELVVFKRGYGNHRLRVGAREEETWKQLSLTQALEQEDVIVELAPVRTPEERRAYLRQFSWPPWIPRDRMSELILTINQERASFGLEKIK